MRLYLYGVLIVLLGSRNFCQDFAIEEENQNVLLDNSSEGIEEKYDIVSEEKQSPGEYQNPYFNGDVPDFGNEGNIDENVAYWESIYGTEDVPDFEVPPEINGESIFMELGDLEDESDGPETNLVKRTLDETRSDFFHSLSSNEESKNIENPWQFDVSRPDSVTSNEDQFESENSENSQFHGTKEPVLVSYSKHEDSDTSVSDKVVESGSVDGAEEMEAAETRSIKYGNRNVESIFNAKLKLLQDKKDFVDSATAEAHKQIDANKEMINSMISTKADLVGKGKEILASAAATKPSHDFSQISVSKPSESYAGKLGTMLDAKLDKKKEIVHSATVAGLGHGSSHLTGSQADKLGSILDVKADVIEKKKEIIHSAAAASGLSGGLPGIGITSGTHAEKLGSILDATADVIEKKKEIIHSAAAASGLSGGLPGIGITSGTHAEKLGSILDATADVIEKKKEIIHSAAAASGLSGGLPGIGITSGTHTEKLGSILDATADVIEKKKEIIHSAAAASGLSHGLPGIDIKSGTHAEKLGSILDATAEKKKEIIHSATVAGLAHGSSHLTGSHADKLGSMLAAKADAIGKKKEIINSATAASGLSHGLGLPAIGITSGTHAEKLESILDAAAEKKKEITHSATVAGLGHGSSHLTGSHADTLGSILNVKADAIGKKKEIIHSAAAASGSSHGLPGIGITSGTHAEKLGSILDATAEKKKEIINAATVAGLGHDLSGSKKSKVPGLHAEAAASLLNAKSDMTKEIIHSAAAAAAAGTGHGLSSHMKSKSSGTHTEKLESIIEAKTDAVEKTKEVIHSAAVATLSQPKKSKTSGSYAGKLGSMLDAKVDRKKEIIHSATVAGIGHGLSHSTNTKLPGSHADALESILNAKGDLIERNKEIIGSAKTAELSHGLSQPKKSKLSGTNAGKLESILGTKADLIDKKKDIIDSTKTAKLSNGLLSQPKKSKLPSIHAEELGSVLESKADKQGKLIPSTKVTGMSHGLSQPKKSKLPGTDVEKLEPILGAKADDKGKIIPSATVAGISHGLSQPKKSELPGTHAVELGPILEAKADNKGKLIPSTTATGISQGLSQSKKSKLPGTRTEELESILKTKADNKGKITKSATVTGASHGLSQPKKSKISGTPVEKVKSIVDAEVEKKEILQSATVGGMSQGLGQLKKSETLLPHVETVGAALGDKAADIVKSKTKVIDSVSTNTKTKTPKVQPEKLQSKIDAYEKKKKTTGYGLSYPEKPRKSKSEMEIIKSISNLKSDINGKRQKINNPVESEVIQSSKPNVFESKTYLIRGDSLRQIDSQPKIKDSKLSSVIKTIRDEKKLQKEPLSTPNSNVDKASIISQAAPEIKDKIETVISTKLDAEATKVSKQKPSLVSEEILSSKIKDKPEIIAEKCGTGQCGITGKLYVDSVNSFESGSQQKSVEAETILGHPYGDEVTPNKESIVYVKSDDNIPNVKAKNDETILVSEVPISDEDQATADSLTSDEDTRVLLGLPTTTVNQDSVGSLTSDTNVPLELPLDSVEERTPIFVETTQPQYQHTVPSTKTSGTVVRVVPGLTTTTVNQDSADSLISDEDTPVLLGSPATSVEDRTPIVVGTTQPQYQHTVPSTKTDESTVYVVPELTTTTVNQNPASSLTSDEDTRVLLGLPATSVEDRSPGVVGTTHPQYQHTVPATKTGGPAVYVVPELTTTTVNQNPASSLTSDEDTRVLLGLPATSVEDRTPIVVGTTQPQYQHTVPSTKTDKPTVYVVPELTTTTVNQNPAQSSLTSDEDTRVLLGLPAAPVKKQKQVMHEISQPQDSNPVLITTSDEVSLEDGSQAVLESPALTKNPDSANSRTISETLTQIVPGLPVANNQVSTAFQGDDSSYSFSTSDGDGHVILGGPFSGIQDSSYSITMSDEDGNGDVVIPVYHRKEDSSESLATSEENNNVLFGIPQTKNQQSIDLLEHVASLNPDILGLPIPTAPRIPLNSLSTSEEDVHVGSGLPVVTVNRDSAESISASEEHVPIITGLPVPTETQASADSLSISEEDEPVVPGLYVSTGNQNYAVPLIRSEKDRVAFGEPQFEEEDRVAFGEPQFEKEDRVVFGEPQFEKEDRVAFGEPQFDVEDRVALGEPQFEEKDRVAFEEPQFEVEDRVALGEPQFEKEDRVAFGEPEFEEKNAAYSIKPSNQDDRVTFKLPIPIKDEDSSSEESAEHIASELPGVVEEQYSGESLSVSEEDVGLVSGSPIVVKNQYYGEPLSVGEEDVRVVSGSPIVVEDGYSGAPLSVSEEDVRVVSGSPIVVEDGYSGEPLSVSEEGVRLVPGSPIVVEDRYSGEPLSLSEEDVRLGSGSPIPTGIRPDSQSSINLLTQPIKQGQNGPGLPIPKGSPNLDKKIETVLKPVDSKLQLDGVKASIPAKEFSDVVGAIAPTIVSQKTGSIQSQKNIHQVIVQKSGHATSVISDLEHDLNDEDLSSTYEEKFVQYYSNAADNNQRHETTQNTEQLAHFQSCFDDLPKDVEYIETDGTITNTNSRLINLDVNCSGMTAFMKPECQRLNVKVWQPEEESATPMTLWTVKSYLSHGQELAIEMQNRAKWLCDQGLVPQIHTPDMLHLINNFASETCVGINQASEYSLFGTKLLQRRFSSEFDVTPNTFVEFLKNHAFRVVGTGLCHPRPKRCEFDQLYRSFDGGCNNRNHPTWGQANTAFARILPARYNDGVHEPPISVLGNELPNPRALTTHCYSDKSKPDPKCTLALVQWGQILSHDFALQTIDQTVEGGIECCRDGKHLPKKLQHHSCFAINISREDKFYSKHKTGCMNFVRSMTISKEDCTLGPADQLNTVTSYLDVSPLYGSNKETCDKLRSFKDGRMSVAIRRGRELLPVVKEKSRFCDVMSPSEVCYLAGDVRVNQNPQLAILQTILLREHNRIADRLSSLNPHWTDERIFQESRKIVIAEYQHITYNEWLPVVIGKKYCQKHRLTLRSKNVSMSTSYDPRIKAATINSFTTAAFRFFHSMVQGNINLCPASREISHTLRLSNHYFRPQVIERSNNLDDLIRGLASQPMQQADDNFHPELSSYLFRSRNEFGLDLEALDIQRGRDHGLPCYNAYRKLCGLKYAKNFDDLIEEMEEKSIEKLKSIYAHVDDIDLIVGSVMEKKSPGSILGPTIKCILSEQFYRSKIGDRYFYDIADQPHSFTQAQFNEIRKVSLARLLCDNGDNIEKIQPKVFKIISEKNPLKCCCTLPQIDLTLWRELNY